MFKLIAFLFTGCWHRWELVSKHTLLGDGQSRGMTYISRCSKCGKHKREDLK